MKTINKGGYCAIGVFRGKTEHNIGTLWRSAYILGAAYIFTVDNKYKKQTSDVLKSWSRIPLFHYSNFDELLNNREPFLRKGKGVFYFRYEDSNTQVKGDRYLRYKLEFTKDGVWQTKIDSVFLPTSLEVYRDTIYY